METKNTFIKEHNIKILKYYIMHFGMGILYARAKVLKNEIVQNPIWQSICPTSEIFFLGGLD